MEGHGEHQVQVALAHRHGPLEEGEGSTYDSLGGDLESVQSNESRLALGRRVSRAHNRNLSIWDRVRGKGRKKVGWAQSLKSIVTYSWLNMMLVFVPIAWAVTFAQKAQIKADIHPISHTITFSLSFLAIVPLSKLLDYGGEQMALYCGPDLGDLIVVTFNNAVEAILALVLLAQCELRLLQSTIIGVVLLRLLLIPGTAFITGGAHVMEQELHPHLTELNHSLLTTGVLTLLLPAAFFAAFDRGFSAEEEGIIGLNGKGVVNDAMRYNFLQISRGLAIILLAVYICSRFFLHDPPRVADNIHHKDVPAEFMEKAHHLEEEEPEVNPGACLLMLACTVGVMAVTAEFLVESIDPVQKKLQIQEEWFGLILLPIVSFSADGILSAVYFFRLTLKQYFGTPFTPTTLAEARAIDLSIQFMIFWMPLLVLIGWFTNKPVSMLFDLFEVALLLGACFLVNYVTADSKTNWAEGTMMVAFYVMIALTAWFYPGQEEIASMMTCESVSEVVLSSAAKEFAPGNLTSTTLGANYAIVRSPLTDALAEALLPVFTKYNVTLK